MIHEFDPIIYPRKVWITYDATADELNKYFPNGDLYNNKFKDEEGYYGITYHTQKGTNKKGGVLIRFDNNDDAMSSWNMMHEALHAAAYICEYVGIKADFDNDEAYTYLATWIMKCCEQVKHTRENIGK